MSQKEDQINNLYKKIANAINYSIRAGSLKGKYLQRNAEDFGSNPTQSTIKQARNEPIFLY